MNHARKLVFGLVITAFGGQAHATVTWRGDFETGNAKQWSGAKFGGNVSIVGSPVRAGTKAARIELHNEDRWGNGLRRVELEYRPPGKSQEGSEHFYAWSMYPAIDMPLAQQHNVKIGYWESDPLYQLVMGFEVNRSKINFSAWLMKPDGNRAGTLFSNGNFAPGMWHDFILHVKWSPDPAVGFVELWYDGKKVVNLTHVQTMHRVNGVTYTSFLSLGILRVNIDSAPEALFLDSAMAATAFDDVKNAAEEGGGGPGGVPDAGPSADAAVRDARPGDGAAVSKAIGFDGSSPRDQTGMGAAGREPTPGPEDPSDSTAMPTRTKLDAAVAADDEEVPIGKNVSPGGCACTFSGDSTRVGGLALLLALSFSALAVRRYCRWAHHPARKAAGGVFAAISVR